MCVSCFRRGFDFIVHRVRLAEGDIVTHSAGGKPCVLKNHSVSCTEVVSSHVADVRSVNFYAAVANVIKTHEQVYKRCFSASCRTDDCNSLSRSNGKGKLFYKRSTRHVRKRNVFKLDPSFRLGRYGIFRFGHLVIFVKKVKHSVGAGKCVLELRYNAAYLIERFCILGSVAEKYAELTDGDMSRHGGKRTYKGDNGVNNIVYESCRRVCQA